MFLVGILVPIAPATLHNYIASKDFVLINYTAGFSFFVGNNPQATGVADLPLGISSSPQLEERQAADYAARESGRPLKPSEISTFWLRKGLAFALHDPQAWLKLTVRKAGMFLNRRDSPDDYSLSFVRDNFPSLLKLRLLDFTLVAILGFFGLCLFWDAQSGSVFLLMGGIIYSASVIFTFISDRYRMPAAVFMLPFAAVFIDSVLRGQLLREEAAIARLAARIEREGKYDSSIEYVQGRQKGLWRLFENTLTLCWVHPADDGATWLLIRAEADAIVHDLERLIAEAGVTAALPVDAMIMYRAEGRIRGETPEDWQALLAAALLEKGDRPS